MINSYDGFKILDFHTSEYIDGREEATRMAIFEDYDGSLWIGNEARFVQHYDWNTNHFEQILAESVIKTRLMIPYRHPKTQQLWWGTRSKGLVSFDEEKKEE